MFGEEIKDFFLEYYLKEIKDFFPTMNKVLYQHILKFIFLNVSDKLIFLTIKTTMIIITIHINFACINLIRCRQKLHIRYIKLDISV